MKTNQYIITFILVLMTGMLIGFAFTRSCSRAPDTITDTTYITQVIPGDSVLYPIIVRIPYPVYIDTGSIIHQYYPIDTLAILADYFRIRYYSDTIYQPENFRAVIKDSINFNRIIWRGFEIQNLKTTAIYTTQITHSDCNIPWFALGADAIFNSQAVYLGPGIMYRARNNAMYRVGIYFAYNQRPAITAGYYKPINFKKK